MRNEEASSSPIGGIDLDSTMLNLKLVPYELTPPIPINPEIYNTAFPTKGVVLVQIDISPVPSLRVFHNIKK